MGFFDFIGNKPDQLSLPEILSAIPAVAGPVLMQRGRRVGLPLGIGLSALGGLGQEYAQRQRQQSQHEGVLNLIKSMPGVTPEMQKSFEAAVNQGVDPTPLYDALVKNQMKTTAVKPIFAMQNGKEVALNPETGQKLYDVQGFTSSFKPKEMGGSDISVPVRTQLKAMGVDPSKASAEQITAAEDAITARATKPSWRIETDPTTGATIQNAYRYNAKTGKMELVPTAGAPGGVPTKLDPAERKQLDAVRLVSTQIPRFKSLIAALPPDTSPAVLAKEYAKFRAPFGALGPVDPRFSNYFQQIGQLKAQLISSAASGFRGQYILDILKQHIPSETDPPARAMEKVQGFDAGGFNAVLQNYLGTGTPLTPKAESAGAGTGTVPPKPPFEVDKAYNKDGQWYVKDKAGKFYQFDGSRWAPL